MQCYVRYYVQYYVTWYVQYYVRDHADHHVHHYVQHCYKVYLHYTQCAVTICVFPAQPRAYGPRDLILTFAGNA